ncbi:hypothetical protein M8J75_000799 [Diaphorina citri]|nr:hypothetical protein M8J75_000799 [Diaphorina citri]
MTTRLSLTFDHCLADYDYQFDYCYHPTQEESALEIKVVADGNVPTYLTMGYPLLNGMWIVNGKSAPIMTWIVQFVELQRWDELGTCYGKRND